MSAPGRLSRRMAALGILGCLLLAGWQLLLQPLVSRHWEIRERIETARVLLGRLRLAETELAAALKETAVAPTAAPAAYLQGSSEAIALAGLQASVTAAAVRHGVRPQTTRMLPVVERDDMRLAGIRIDVTAPMEVLQQLLYALETASPVLFVDHLTLEAVSASARGGARDDGQLRAGIHVYGVLPRKKD